MRRPDGAAVIDEAIALKAAEYFFLLREKDVRPQDADACARWRAADPQHEQAWQRALQVSSKFDRLPPSLAVATFSGANRNGRRQAIKTLALLLAAVPAGWMAWRSPAALVLRADYSTAIGERTDITLADGSRVYLNSGSAIDVSFDQTQRTVHLLAGEILVETAPDRGIEQAVADQLSYRPFAVETAQGRITALGTRFMVRQVEQLSRVALFSGQVEIRPARLAPADRALLLSAGQQTHFSAQSVDAVQPLAQNTDSWIQGKLYASNMRLDDFLAELGRYRHGILRCEPDIAMLRISGVFQLRDIEQVLQSLPNALPVDVRYRTRYWVTLVARTG